MVSFLQKNDVSYRWVIDYLAYSQVSMQVYNIIINKEE